MSFPGSINVVNRKGESIPMHLETISNRLSELVAMEPCLSISTDYVATQTAASLIDGIKTSEIDGISAAICASLIVEEYEYDALAARIIISNLHKTTYSDVRLYAKALTSYQYRDTQINILHPKTIAFLLENSKDLNDLIDYSKDYSYNYFGAMTLINAYLLAYKFDNNQKVVKERPQQMLLRVAIGIHLNDIDDDGACDNHTFLAISETYKLLSDKYYTHATPTLFNAGTINPTLSSCYLLSINDSLNNIYQRLVDISKISKFAGGVGVHVSQVRAQGSIIASTLGRSEGLVPMMRVLNESTRYVNQGGKRNGSTAVYLEPWHADIESALMSQKQQGIPEKLCRDLFLAMWMPDLFWTRLRESYKSGEPVMWSLMCPNECKGLTDVYGEEFKHLYEQYEREKKYRKQVPILQLAILIFTTQIETGKPYIMNKDHVNRKCNQNNLGTIKSSNLCVHGDTHILTYQGYKPIKDLAGQSVAVWNGNEWSLSPVARTGTNQSLVKVRTSDGAELCCTPYHKFKLTNGLLVEAKDLKPDNLLTTCVHWPLIDGNQMYDNKESVPINAPMYIKRSWLAQYLDNHSLVSRSMPQQLRLNCDSKQLALDIKLMCNTMGFSPTVQYENDQKDCGAYVLFSSKDTFYMFKIMNLPATTPDMEIEPSHSFGHTLSVISVEEVPGVHDTFCFNEPVRHMGVFNGIYTSQCSEITIYSDDEQVGVCNLASICLPKFVRYAEDGTCEYDFKKLNQVVQRVVYNMNQVIDNNKYPIAQAQHSDDWHRPIGVGVQGLSDVFMMMDEPYDSEHSRKLNSQIFETIYFAALSASNKLAQRDGAYSTFRTSMLANGVFQFDLWDNTSVSKELNWNWDDLRHKIQMSGVRNSLLTCIMPTASTAIIMGNNESIESPQSNIFKRATLSGHGIVVNKHLMHALKKIGLWNKNIRQQLFENDGSVQNIAELPQHIKDVYKTAYEYKLSSLLEMCADRERFICQSASNNRYIMNPTVSKLMKMHLYAHKLGLKTSSYYVRPKQVVTGKKLHSSKADADQNSAQTYQPDEPCMSCSA